MNSEILIHSAMLPRDKRSLPDVVLTQTRYRINK